MADENVVRSDFYVYVLFRPDTGQPFYVGKGCGRRIRISPFDGSNPYKHNIAQKAKREGRSIPKVKIAANLTEAEAFKLEAAFIGAISRHPDGPLVNVTDGGEGSSGHKQTEETCAKKRAVLKGRSQPHLIGNQHAKGNCHTLTSETRARQSLASKGHKRLVGRKHTAETRARMRSARALRGPVSEVTREKMAAAKRGKTYNIEQRARMSASKIGLTKGLIWITDGKQNKRVRPDTIVVEGWWRGHVLRKKHADSGCDRRFTG